MQVPLASRARKSGGVLWVAAAKIRHQKLVEASLQEYWCSQSGQRESVKLVPPRLCSWRVFQQAPTVCVK